MASDFSTFITSIKSLGLLAIANHWHQMRADRLMPAWSDLNPAAIAPYLTRIWAFKYDRGSGEFIGRLAGDRITVATGRNFRGITLKELVSPDSYERSLAGLTRIVTEPAIYRSHGLLFRIGERVVEGERIALPLADDGQHADGVVGGTEYPFAGGGQGAVDVFSENEEWYSP